MLFCEPSPIPSIVRINAGPAFSLTFAINDNDLSFIDEMSISFAHLGAFLVSLMTTPNYILNLVFKNLALLLNSSVLCDESMSCTSDSSDCIPAILSFTELIISSA